MCYFTHHLRQALFIEISGSHKYHFIIYLDAQFENATIVCSVCSIEKKIFKNGEMGRAGEKWDKKLEEVLQMRLSGLDVKKRQTVQQQTWKRRARQIEADSYGAVLVNPRSAGGGKYYPPPSRIFSIAQKRQRILTRNFQYLLRHQFDVY